MSQSQVQSFRFKDNDRLPAFYHWFGHIGLNLALLAASLVLAIRGFETSISILALSLIAGFILTWGVIEYGLHRYILHGHQALFRNIAKEHAINHHHYFTSQSMSAERPVDLSRVFLFSHHLLSLLFVNAVLSTPLFWLRHDLGRLFFISGLLYISAYEALHAVSHFKRWSAVRLLRSITTHHRAHHDLTKMSKTNFAVVFPFLDRWFRSADVELTPVGPVEFAILQSKSAEGQRYEELLEKKFPKLKGRGTRFDCHAILRRGEIYIGGASLINYSDINQDPDVTDHWTVIETFSGTRILRMWADRPVVVPRLLAGIHSTLEEKGDFIYGIISIPLGWVRANQEMFAGHLKYIQPHIDLTSCTWPEEEASTSDGHRLISTYKKIQADFIGPLAGCPSETTVRAVMGIRKANLEQPAFLDRYAILP
jgi:hypothetical protein